MLLPKVSTLNLLTSFHFCRLWFDELLGLWVSVQNLPQWEGVSVFVFVSVSHPVAVEWLHLFFCSWTWNQVPGKLEQFQDLQLSAVKSTKSSVLFCWTLFNCPLVRFFFYSLLGMPAFSRLIAETWAGLMAATISDFFRSYLCIGPHLYYCMYVFWYAQKLCRYMGKGSVTG